MIAISFNALPSDDYFYTLCTIGTLVFTTVLLWCARPRVTSQQNSPSSTTVGGGLSVHTFSSSVLVVPGQATILAYDSSASSAGKRPVARPTILQEFPPAYAYIHAVDKLDNPNQTSYPEDRKSFPSSVPSPDNGYDAAAMQTLRPKTPSSTHNADSGPTSWTADGNSVLKQHCHGSAGPNGLLGSLSQTLDGFRRKSPSTTICSSSHCSDSSSPPSVTDLVTGTIPGPDDRSPIPTSKARSTTPTLLQPPDDDGTVSSPGVHIYIRRVVRNTAFFQFADKVDGAIEVPSELSKHPDLMLGDLFYHRSGTKCQMWIWEKETAQQLRWRPVGWGYERKSDRKVLILSEKKALPSWVQKSHFLKHTQGHPELQAMVMIPGSQT